MTYRNWSCFTGIVLLLLASTAQATIITTSDKSAFLSLPGASSLTGPIPNLGNVGTTATLGDVTFSTTAYSTTTNIYFGTGTSGPGWSTVMPGNEIALSGTENLDVSINLGHTVSSFGFDFVEPSQIRDENHNTHTNTTNTPYFHQSVFTIELFDGLTSVGTTTFNPDDDVLLFFGLTSDNAFDSVRITENLAGITYLNGGRLIDISNDNEFFGEFYAASGTTTVPEPTSLALIGLGLAGLGWKRRRLN